MTEAAKRLIDRIEELDTANAANRHRAESFERMAGELATVQGRAASPDGLVSVVATANGALCSITFGEGIRTVPPGALSAAVLHTVAAARMAATRQQAEVVRRNLGDTELLDQVLSSEERLFGDRPPIDPGPPPLVSQHAPLVPPVPHAPLPQQNRPHAPARPRPRGPVEEVEASFEHDTVMRRPPGR
jgi:hypothetical protein